MTPSQAFWLEPVSWNAIVPKSRPVAPLAVSALIVPDVTVKSAEVQPTFDVLVTDGVTVPMYSVCPAGLVAVPTMFTAGRPGPMFVTGDDESAQTLVLFTVPVPVPVPVEVKYANAAPLSPKVTTIADATATNRFFAEMNFIAALFLGCLF